MPTKIAKPEIDDINLLNQIVIERRGGANESYFQAYKATWEKRINEYNLNCGNPEKISASNIENTDKNKFINLYNNPQKTIKIDIIDKLRDHDLDFCPFCGEAGTPATLDHFLPKDIYPEYSFLSINLVPMCDICQRPDAKGSKIFDANGLRLFFHPYFDGTETLEILILEILPPYTRGTNFILKINPILDDPLKSVCIKHIAVLKIRERYRKHFIRAFERLKKHVKTMLIKGFDKEDIPNIINGFYVKDSMVSVNYWDAIFYKSVLNNRELMEYLKVLPIEEYEK